MRPDLRARARDAAIEAAGWTPARAAALLPHRAFWLRVGGLVRDGVAFAKAGGGVRSGADALEPLAEPAAAEGGGEAEAGRAERAGVKAKAGVDRRKGARGELHAAAMAGRAGRLKKLLKQTQPSGKELDAADAKGWTAYHHACALGHADCVKLLCVAGTGTAVATPAGETGWQLAEQLRQPKVCALLARFAKKGHPALALEKWS